MNAVTGEAKFSAAPFERPSWCVNEQGSMGEVPPAPEAGDGAGEQGRLRPGLQEAMAIG